MRAALVLVALAVASAAAAAPARDTLLRPGVGIGEVRLGMSEAQVRRALGRPDRVGRRNLNGHRDYVEYVWGVLNEVRVGFYRGSTEYISTTLRERTRRGLGVGS